MEERAQGKDVQLDKAVLDELWEHYNDRKFVHPDPLEFLYRYPQKADREIVGLIASSLAYGRVQQILKSVEGVLSQMGPPREFLENMSHEQLYKTFTDFKHRFTTGEHLSCLLSGIKKVLKEFGSLEKCFLSHLSSREETVLPAMEQFSKSLICTPPGGKFSLVPWPSMGSACKRLNLYLRWMVRKDAVDLGDWGGVSPAKLVIPLDVHMHRIALYLGLTERKQADCKAALEVTDKFRMVEPEDPVKYDFALTRTGIRRDEEDFQLDKIRIGRVA